MNNCELHIRLKEILKEKKLTNKEFAQMIGKAPQYVSNIVNGTKPISITQLLEISKILNIEFYELFTERKKPINNNANCPHCGKLIKIRLE